MWPSFSLKLSNGLKDLNWRKMKLRKTRAWLLCNVQMKNVKTCRLRKSSSAKFNINWLLRRNLTSLRHLPLLTKSSNPEKLQLSPPAVSACGDVDARPPPSPLASAHQPLIGRADQVTKCCVLIGGSGGSVAWPATSAFLGPVQTWTGWYFPRGRLNSTGDKIQLGLVQTSAGGSRPV